MACPSGIHFRSAWIFGHRAEIHHGQPIDTAKKATRRGRYPLPLYLAPLESLSEVTHAPL